MREAYPTTGFHPFAPTVALRRLIQRATELVGFFKKSAPRHDALEDTLVMLAEKGVSLDGATDLRNRHAVRWTGCHRMLESIHGMRPVLRQYFED